MVNGGPQALCPWPCSQPFRLTPYEPTAASANFLCGIVPALSICGDRDHYVVKHKRSSFQIPAPNVSEKRLKESTGCTEAREQLPASHTTIFNGSRKSLRLQDRGCHRSALPSLTSLHVSVSERSSPMHE